MDVLDRLQPLRERPDPRLSWLARAGLVAHGALYVVIGLLSLEIARRGGGEEADTIGAVEAVAEQPYGWTLVAVLTIGLVALVVWRSVQAVEGDPVAGSTVRDRGIYAVKAVVYASLTFAAVRVLLGEDAGSGEEEAKSLTAHVLELPLGRLLIAAVGALLVLAGLRNALENAGRAEFTKKLDHGKLGARGLEVVRTVGRVGFAARSVVFVLMGAFLVEAAIAHDPEQTRGLSGALHELASQSWGRPVLWLVAVGLGGYGLLSLFLARYRRIAS